MLLERYVMVPPFSWAAPAVDASASAVAAISVATFLRRTWKALPCALVDLVLIASLLLSFA